MSQHLFSEQSTDKPPIPHDSPTGQNPCTFKVFLCSRSDCDQPALDIVKTSDCGCITQHWRRPACVERWCAAKDNQDGIMLASGEPGQKLVRSVPRTWDGCNHRLHFCREHSGLLPPPGPSSGPVGGLATASQTRPQFWIRMYLEAEPLTRPYNNLPWSGPFPGEYPVGPDTKDNWLAAWELLAPKERPGRISFEYKPLVRNAEERYRANAERLETKVVRRYRYLGRHGESEREREESGGRRKCDTSAIATETK